MAASNRASRLTKLVTDLKKKFKPTKPAERPLFETLLYATLLENSTHEAADKALAELEKVYFDWNEVRVSSRPELAERLKPLNDPSDAADRLKRTLQSIFETVYAFDLEAMKKQNLGQAVKQITAFDGVTPFVVAYATQQGLGGHAIAVNSGVLLSLQVMDVITEAEVKKHSVPGLERAIPKNKGVEAHTVLHQLGVEVNKNPYGTGAKKLLTELDPTCKDRLPKRPAKEKEKPAKAAAKKKRETPNTPPKKEAAKKPAAATRAKAAAKPTTKSAEPKKAAASKKPATKAAAPKKAAAKKKPAKAAATKKKAPASKVAPKKKAAKKSPAKKTTKKAAKRKPK